MRLFLKPTSVIIADLGLEPKGPIQSWFTNTCALHMDKYVPMDTGALAETVVVDGQINKKNVYRDRIVYNQDYAVYVYYPSDRTLHLDKHPQATHYWDQVMWTAEKNEVIREVQNYFNKRR